jgi:hypothetical protein
MGNLRACFAVATLALAACGSDSAKTDAGIVLIDSPMVDAKVFNDAPPKNYDLSCLNQPQPTTASDPITIAGATVELSQGGGSGLANVDIQVFEEGTQTALATTTSGANGVFATGEIETSGTPIEGYLRAELPGANAQTASTHRTTYMYPPSPLSTSLTDAPVLMFATSTFNQIATALGGQNDTLNGAMFFVVTDCSDLQSQTLIGEADVSVQQDGKDEGTILGLSIIDPQLAGTYVVVNVPDGLTDIKVTYDGMSFPTRTVRAFKKPAGDNAVGTLTVTVVRPGP